MSRRTIRPYVNAQLVQARAFHLRGDPLREWHCLRQARALAAGAWLEVVRVQVWMARAGVRNVCALLRPPVRCSAAATRRVPAVTFVGASVSSAR
jgi:hypothetical protein